MINPMIKIGTTIRKKRTASNFSHPSRSRSPGCITDMRVDVRIVMLN